MQPQLVESPSDPQSIAKVRGSRPLRLWLPLSLVLLYWASSMIVSRIEKLYFIGFLYGMASAAVLILAYFAWWWANRGMRLTDKCLGFALILGAGVAVEPLCHTSIGWFALWTMGLPIVLTVWTLWLWA